MMERYEVMDPSTLINTKSDVSMKMSFNEIAMKLLNEKLILTALELHAELCETGRELPVLRDFFTNPHNFEASSIKPTESYVSIPRSSSQASIYSLDMTRYSEDGGGVDERVAILEFELRKAKENIIALRANLTVIVESEGSSPSKNKTEDNPIKPHELKALNFLVYEYLLGQSYKLTSITFSDENENQDFEDWEDVGLNIPKLPNLLQIFREFFRKNGHDRPSFVDASVQTDLEFSDPNPLTTCTEIDDLKQRIVLLEEEKLDLEQRYEQIDAQVKSVTDEMTNKMQVHSVISNSTTPDKFEIVDSLHRASQDADDDSTSAGLSLGDTDPGDKDWMRIHLPKIDTNTILDPEINQSRSLPNLFKQQILACAEITSETGSQPQDVSFELIETYDSLVDFLATSLPAIVPNIILNKREEIIALVLNTIRLHSDVSVRDKLLELLFNLKKKPQKDERRILLRALVLAAKTPVSPLESEEVLTVCWEQTQHRYMERRLLAVECCSALAPHTSSAIRNSLVISMLQQMLLDDKEPFVRTAVVRSLTLLVALADDPDKYFQCEELALAALDDVSLHVSDVASTILLPTLAQWALSLKRLYSHLLPRVILKLKGCLQHLPSKDHGSSEKAIILINSLRILLPHTIVGIVNTAAVRSIMTDGALLSSEFPQEFLALIQSNLNDPRVFLDDPEDISKIYNTFLTCNISEKDIYPELEWFNTKLLVDVSDMIKTIDLSHEKVLDSLLMYVKSLCSGFCHQAVQARMKSIFEDLVKELENSMALPDVPVQSSITLSVIPAYLLILSLLNMADFVKALKHFIIMLSTNSSNISSLTTSVRLLCQQPGSLVAEPILTALWSGVVHQKPSVRSTTARLFGEIVSSVEEQLIISRVTPAIITLASDSDVMVKGSAILAIGKLIIECPAEQVQDKGRLTLESIVREPHGVPQALAIPLITTFGNIVSICPQHYVEDIIATQLTGITAFTLQQAPNASLATALLEAYSTLVYCSLSDECISGVLLPGLKYLESLVNDFLPQYKENVRSLIREAELKQNRQKSTEKSTSSGLSLTLTGQGVEDMRHRMTKMFTPKSNSGMSSLFRKK